MSRFFKFDVSNIDSFEKSEFPSLQLINRSYLMVNDVLAKALKNYCVS